MSDGNITVKQEEFHQFLVGFITNDLDEEDDVPLPSGHRSIAIP